MKRVNLLKVLNEKVDVSKKYRLEIRNKTTDKVVDAFEGMLNDVSTTSTAGTIGGPRTIYNFQLLSRYKTDLKIPLFVIDYLEKPHKKLQYDEPEDNSIDFAYKIISVLQQHTIKLFNGATKSKRPIESEIPIKEYYGSYAIIFELEDSTFEDTTAHLTGPKFEQMWNTGSVMPHISEFISLNAKHGAIKHAKTIHKNIPNKEVELPEVAESKSNKKYPGGRKSKKRRK